MSLSTALNTQPTAKEVHTPFFQESVRKTEDFFFHWDGVDMDSMVEDRQDLHRRDISFSGIFDEAVAVWQKKGVYDK